MAKLVNKTTGTEIAADVELAEGFVSRAVGLLGRANLPEGRALWIKRCGSVHTWFMRFSIDVIFVDDRLVATKISRELKPWRMTLPELGPRSAFELPAGTLRARPVKKGDQLHVGD